MIVIAHRGASLELPENTLAAFARAVAVGADAIEMDLRVSSDGVVYVAHDRAVDPEDPEPATGRPLAWERIRALSGRQARYPRLAEVLDALAGRIELNLEIKERAAAPIVVAEIRRRRLEGILLSSFDPRTMREIRELAPEIGRGYLCRRAPRRLGAALARLGARALHLHRAAVDARVLARARAAGVPVHVWTVDEPAEMKRLQALGAGGVFTNAPGLARSVFPPAVGDAVRL